MVALLTEKLAIVGPFDLVGVARDYADQLLGVAAGTLRAEHSMAQTDKSFFPAAAK